MPKPGYAVTCYKVLFEISHVQKLGRAVVLHPKSAGHIAKKVMLAGAQVCLVMTGDCPQVFLVAG